MRRALVVAFVLTLVGGALTPVVADYYASKPDFREGRQTAGGPMIKTGTDDCTSPTPIPSLTFADTGDTTGATNTVNNIPLACNGNYAQVAGADHIYTFDVATSNSLTFELQTSSVTYDPSIYVVSTCGDGNTCVTGAAADNCFATELTPPVTCQGTDSTETFAAPVLAPGTYFFYVDSFYSTSNTARSVGPYTLTVTGTLPVELLEFVVE